MHMMMGLFSQILAMTVVKITIVGEEKPRHVIASHFTKMVFYAGLMQE